MLISTTHFSPFAVARCLSPPMLLTLALGLSGALPARAADNGAAKILLSEARTKEVHAQELRAAAAAALQKAADDQMEAAAEERDARIFTARALSALGADAQKQKAFNLRLEARKLWTEAHRKAIDARNADGRASQERHNAEELMKAASQVKDQATIAGTLENEAKDQTSQAQTNAQAAARDKSEAQALEQRASAAWAQAEKLDPETHRQLAPPSPKPGLAEQHQVK